MLFLISLFFQDPAFAARSSYELKMELSLPGQKLISPVLVVKDGQEASIGQSDADGDRFLDVLATESGREGILMKFRLGLVGKDGKRNILAEPMILAREKEYAKVEMEGEKGEKVALSVLARKIQDK